MAQLLNSRNELLNLAATRILGAGVYITSGVANSFTIPANGTTALPGVLTLTAVPSRYVAPQYTWSRRFGDTGDFVVIEDATSSTLEVLGNAQFVTDAAGAGIVQYRVDVVESGTLGANPSNFTLTLPILRQGVNSVVGVLTNDAQTVAADTEGIVPEGTIIQSTLIIYNGISDDSANWTAALTSVTPGITATLINGKTINVALPLTAESGSIEITASRQGYPNIIKLFNISKARAGTSAVDYDVEIESTNGTIFRVGQARTTMLIARVFRNGEDITETIPASKFKWFRVSMNPNPPPNDDTSWNALYAQGYKQIMVSVDSVSAQATFHCQILE